MKKFYLLGIIASAALAMTSCSSDEVTDNGGANSQAIEFGTYVGRDAQVRSANAITSDDDLKKTGNGFGVFAFYTGQGAFAAATTPNFMNNQQVKWNTGDSKWEYSPLKYWPNTPGDKVSFFAYAPYDANKQWSTDSKIDYEVKNNVTEQVDLLFAPGVKDVQKQNISNNVTFTFKHALARIGFSVAYAADQTAEGGTLDAATKITINKVVIRKKDASTETDGVFYKTGNLTLTAANADDAWANKAGAQAFTLATDNFTATELSSATAKIDNLNKDDSYVMIIPQSTEFEVYVEYTVTTTDASHPNNSSTIENKITTPVNTAINFEANKSYTLNLVLGMTSVKVNASVEDWTPGSTTPVDVPANHE